MNKKIQEFTNNEFLKELAQRIVDNRLKVENCINCQAPFDRWSGLVNLGLSDNEWQDKTKPDYTGGRANLNYWIMEARNKN